VGDRNSGVRKNSFGQHCSCSKTLISKEIVQKSRSSSRQKEDMTRVVVAQANEIGIKPHQKNSSEDALTISRTAQIPTSEDLNKFCGCPGKRDILISVKSRLTETFWAIGLNCETSFRFITFVPSGPPLFSVEFVR
jgi:hypothetical protein